MVTDSYIVSYCIGTVGAGACHIVIYITQ